ncbi:MAG: substrate-binding domain-containing protein [Nitrososphaerota archaeon]
MLKGKGKLVSKLVTITLVFVMVTGLMFPLAGCGTSSPATSSPATSSPATSSPATSSPEASAPANVRYDLTKDTPFKISMDLHSWPDWWINTPTIWQFRKDPPYTIGFITSWRGEPWQETAIAEFKREAQRWISAGLVKDIVHMDSAASVDTEISNLNSMFTMWKQGKLDGIIVDPLDPKALNSTIEEINDAGCPIFLWNDAADTTKYTCAVLDDPWTFGTQAAEWLAKKLNYKGNILFFRGLQGYPIDLGRSGGALSVFQKYPDIHIVAIEYADWSYDKAKKVFTDMVAAHPNFDGIYSVGGQMSNAIVDAMIEMGMDPSKYPHASEDNNGFMLKCLKYHIPAYASTHPSIMSAIALDLMVMMFQGYPIPKLYFFPGMGIPDDQFSKYARPNAPEGIFVCTPLSDEELNSIIK